MVEWWLNLLIIAIFRKNTDDLFRKIEADNLLKQEGDIQTERRAGTIVRDRASGTLPETTKQALSLAVAKASKTELGLCRSVYAGAGAFELAGIGHLADDTGV